MTQTRTRKKTSTTTVEYVVSADLLAAAGELWGGTPSAISPLRYGTSGPDDLGSLVHAGICEPDGTLAAGVRPALDVLGNAAAVTRVHLSGGPTPSQYMVFWDPSGDTASLVNVDGQMRIEAPAPTGLFVAIIGQHLGSSVLKTVDFDTNLSADETVVLAALMDEARKAFLRARADEAEVGTAGLSATSLAASCAARSDTNLWLKDVVLDLVGSEGLPADRVSAAAASLVEQGLIAKRRSQFHLEPEVEFLASRFPILQTSLVLTVGGVDGTGDVRVSGFTCLQSGVHDLLYLEATGDTVELASVSSAEVLDYANTYLAEPGALAAVAPPSSA